MQLFKRLAPAGLVLVFPLLAQESLPNVPMGGEGPNGPVLGEFIKGVTPRVSSGTPNCIGKFTNSTDLGCSVMWQLGSNIGIGTTTPNYTLEVKQPSYFPGINIVN